MYKLNLWDEDKWNTHSSSYHSSKQERFDDKGQGYNSSKYDSEKGSSSDYMRKEEAREEETKKELLEDSEEDKQENKELRDEDIPFKAAKQIFNENKTEQKKFEPKKDTKSIDDAIKKAIEQEKKVIVMD